MCGRTIRRRQIPTMPRAPERVTFTQIAKPPLPQSARRALCAGRGCKPTIGGSTSRVGVDFSIPIAQTASFFGTFHPDYSNVELDQQSISPTVFQRTYSEVRPFFTQAASYLQRTSTATCATVFARRFTRRLFRRRRQGYALRRPARLFGLAAFDAHRRRSNRRRGGAELHLAGHALERRVSARDHRYSGAHRRHERGRRELVERQVPQLLRQRCDQESGTLVTDPSQGQWLDAGGGWGNQKFALYGIGAQSRQPVQSGRRLRFASRDRRLRALQRAHLDPLAKRQAAFRRREPLHGSLSRRAIRASANATTRSSSTC